MEKLNLETCSTLKCLKFSLAKHQKLNLETCNTLKYLNFSLAKHQENVKKSFIKRIIGIQR